ncbi:MAG: nucleotidyl transferase AbiEii/AbiGii toxin family protein [Planctomycetota bacterium]|jgi:predicted nucleotidyltransferase component of viral defense system
MLHDNTENFQKVLEATSAQTGFPLLLLEKDYYLTMVLSGMDRLSENLIFKGGTCLNKIYYSYYRLSEDLDFIMRLHSKKLSRTGKRKIIKPIKDNILFYVGSYGMTIDDVNNTGRNESSQYIFYIDYDSAVLGNKQSIKLEIGLRFNPILPVSKQKVSHKFLHPFTKEPLFDGGCVNCLALKELVAEKMRATATRLTIVPRDFYDISFLIKSGFDFQDEELWQLFKRKLSEDGFEQDLEKYRINMGRSQEEIANMSSRIEAELLDVLTPDEQKAFDLNKTLRVLNETFKNME